MKPKNTYQLYGMNWPTTTQPLSRELHMIRKGGRWKGRKGQMIGNGLLFHFRLAIKLCWPEIIWHRWLELIIENYLTHRTLVIIGPASSGKTLGTALCVLIDYYAHPSCTTTIICSTTKQRLEDRIWGEIKKLHRSARQRVPTLPGNMIEGIQRLVTDNRDEVSEGRDFRNGVVGVPCKKGDSFVGMGDFAGIKNKRVRLVGDELSLLPRVFVDSISNLDKNPDFKVVGLGNPKETTDALGVLGEPAAHLGGWDGGIDQTPKTKVWETRRPGGVCIQLVGSDSPNLDGKLGCPLITQENIDSDVAFYGKDSVQYTMMNQGMMPRGQGSRRVLTRQTCQKFDAFTAPVWNNSNRIKVAGLDAAYRGVGGDRCVLCFMEFGAEVETDPVKLLPTAITHQDKSVPPARVIIALTDIMIVPISAQMGELPEDQIVDYVRTQCEARGVPPENMFFDAGMRSSLVSAFARKWSNRTQPIDFGGKPSDRTVSYNLDVLAKDYYSKYVTELWFNVRYAVEARQFRGMTDDVCMEFSSREWTIVGNNKTEVEPKAKMKEKTGRSPDLADAVVCAVEGARHRGFVIRKIMPARQRPADHAWKRELREKAAAMAARHTLSVN